MSVSVKVTIKNGTARAFIDGYEYASSSLPVTASTEEFAKLRKRVAQRARCAYSKEQEKFA